MGEGQSIGDIIKNKFDNVILIKVDRPNFDNGLTEEQKKHPTETSLDNYKKFDYIIENDSTIEKLKEKVKQVLKEVE